MKGRKAVTMSPPVLQLVEYTDPYCTWCWGSEPILRKIREVYGDQVRIAFKMGGLVEDVARFYDPLNRIGGEGMFRQVAEHWLDASRRHGMPVDVRVFEDIEGEFRSTYPANIAYKAAEMQGEDLADRFLRRMREAAAAERRPIHRKEVQVELAREVGLDADAFLRALEDGSAEKAFYADLKECRAQGITGFPTFRITNRTGKGLLLIGYRRFEAFERAFRELAGDALVRKMLDGSEQAILAFVRKYGKVATREVAEVFDLSDREADERLRGLESEGRIQRVAAGNGCFWLPALPGSTGAPGRSAAFAMECDAETGLCALPL